MLMLWETKVIGKDYANALFSNCFKVNYIYKTGFWLGKVGF